MSNSFRKMLGLFFLIISIFFLLAGMYAESYLGIYSVLSAVIGVVLLSIGIVFLKVMCDN